MKGPHIFNIQIAIGHGPDKKKWVIGGEKFFMLFFMFYTIPVSDLDGHFI